MPYKTGSWGIQQQRRSIRRKQYFRDYQKRRYAKKREEILLHTRQWQAKNPEKVNAEYQAHSKIPIPNGQLCEKCHIEPAKHRHHPDYSKPLAVMFLCVSCHRKVR